MSKMIAEKEPTQKPAKGENAGSVGILPKIGKWLLHTQESSIIIILVLYITLVTCVNPVFLSIDNLINVLRATGFTLIIVVGMTLVLITGGLDLSIGSVFALGAIVCGLCCQAGIPIILSILIGTLVGVIVGLTIGTTIVKTGIPPLIITLGMQYIIRGVVSVITKGVPVYPLPEGFVSIEKVKLFNVIPIIIPIALVLAFVGHVVLKHTVFGRSVYALGGNQEAARISGININRTKIMVYTITATAAAFSGIIMASRMGSCEPSTGTGLELKVICAAIIGGTSTFGGMGTIIGATLGALFMEIITNSLTLMKISVHWQNLVFGSILVASVLLDQYKRQLMLQQSIKKS